MKISTTFEIVNSFLNEFKNNNINIFNKNDIEQQLYYFSKDKKYSSLFPSLTNLDEILDVYVKCGYLYEFNSSNEPYYVINNNFTNHARENINNIIKSYCNIKKNICFNYINLKYFISNPNRNYFLIDGTNNFCGLLYGLKWNIQTDGKINKRNLKLVKGDKKSFISPFNNCLAEFDQVDFEIVNVENASYVLYQEIYDEYGKDFNDKINSYVSSNIIYTDLIDEKKLDKIAKSYCIKKA